MERLLACLLVGASCFLSAREVFARPEFSPLPSDPLVIRPLIPPVVVQEPPAQKSDESAVPPRQPASDGVATTSDREDPAPVGPESAEPAEAPGVLSPKGTFTVEPAFEVSRSSVLRVDIEGYSVMPGISIGSLDVKEVDRNSYVASLNLRYGLTHRLELSGRVPYVWRDDTTRARPIGEEATEEEVTKARGSGLGDIEVGIHYQLNRGGDWPYFVGNFRFKSRTGKDVYEADKDADTGLPTEVATGSGHYAVEPSVSMILPADPAVFFGNIGYMWILERDVGGQTGSVDPGDVVGLSAGMGLAVTEKASLNFSYQHSIVGSTKQNGETQDDFGTLQVGVLKIGASYRTGRSSRLNFSVAAGLTDDAPDVSVQLSMPYSF